MTNERYGLPGAVIYAETEATYNTDPTVQAANRVMVLEGDFDSFKPEMLDRNGISAYRNGFKKYVGKISTPWSAKVELDHKTVENSAPAVPNCDVWLRCCGFTRTATGNADFVSANVAANGGDNDEIITYTLDDRIGDTNSSVWIEYTEAATGAAEGLKWIIGGGRADWTLNIDAGGYITMDLTGMGVYQSAPAKVSTPTLNDTLPAVQPMVAKGFTGISISDVVGGSTFGGGTANTAPTIGLSATAQVLSASFSGNLGLQEDKGLAASGAICRVAQRPDGPWTGTLVLEQVTWDDDWDLYTFLTDSVCIRIVMCLLDPSTAGNYWELDCTAQIADVAKGDSESRRIVTLSIEGKYPDASSDGGGLLPASQFKMRWATQVAA